MYTPKISRLICDIFLILSLLLIIAYYFLFDHYKIIGESFECSTNSPIQFNYTCRLDRFDNGTQLWSFESVIPKGLKGFIPGLKVRNASNSNFTEPDRQSLEYVIRLRQNQDESISGKTKNSFYNKYLSYILT